MVVELLKFSIPENERALFVTRNEAVWARGLREHPGFVKHEVWHDRNSPCDVYIAIHWVSNEAWQSFPKQKMADLDAEMGGDWPAQSCLALDVLASDHSAAEHGVNQ